jgi:hypothetical protein
MASIIKADNIQKVSDGTNIIKKCGSTTTIGSGASNPIVICGSTVTLGRCGGTVTLASGATQTGFGRTGTVDWCTTAKTAPFTGVSGKGYFVNTTSGAITVTLPATPTAGDIISVKDYAGTWGTNNVTLCRNGNKIASGNSLNPILSTNTSNISLVYVDATQGWLPIEDNTSDISANEDYLVATGGTVSTCGDYKIHTFASDATFTVSSLSTNPANDVVDYLVVAGGGSSGGYGGGGGAGGVRASATTYTIGCNPAGPLVACVAALPVSVTSYPITIGAGGAGGAHPGGYSAGDPGSNSVFSTITSTGGGGGGYFDNNPGLPGGSGGGGGSSQTSPPTPGGSGNTPPVSPPQGQPGGAGRNNTGSGYLGGGGGGGAIAAGSTPVPTGGQGNGGNGAGFTNGAFGSSNGQCSSSVQYFGGGGGGNPGSGLPTVVASTGGLGGGAGGPLTPTATPGTVNTGGGGGGMNDTTQSAGGSGIVVIRYKYK